MHAISISAPIFGRVSAKLLIAAVALVISLNAPGAGATAATASVKITQPYEGQEFSPGRSIEIEADAFNPGGNINALEIYAGTNLVRRIDRGSNPNPAEPMRIGVTWENAPVGAHTITVRALEFGTTVGVSAPVHILVDSAARPMVSVSFHAWGIEPTPYADYSRGAFVFNRTERTDEPLMVFFAVGGTATAGADYIPFASHIIFPPGHSVAGFWPEELDDDIVEGDETLTVELVPPPPGTTTEYPTNYLIGVRSASATISDNESSEAPHLEIISPHYQQLLQEGSNIEFRVIARDPKGYIPKVQLFHGNTLLGTSEIVFETPPAPGTAVPHTIIWSNAPRRSYQGIALRGYNPAGIAVTTNSTSIAVGPNPDRVTLGLYTWGKREASERLTDGLPASSFFWVHRVFGPTNQPVEFSLLVGGTAENGRDYEPINLSGVLEAGVARAHFDVKPIPDELAEGPETLLVRLVDPQCWTTNETNDGTNRACYMVGTNSVMEFTIHDAPSTNVAGVVLSVEVEDSVASEAPLNGVPDTATFRVRRVSGPMDEEVRFAISLGGEGWNGVDYEPIDQVISMEPNEAFVDIVVRPLIDDIGDGNETVILTLTDFDCGQANSASLTAASTQLPSCYDVLGTNVAKATILDSRSGTNHPPRVTITNPPDGAVYEAGSPIEVQVEALDLEGMLNTVVLYLDTEVLEQVSPTLPGPGTNYLFTGHAQFTVTTNPPAGEHTFSAIALDYTGMGSLRSSARVLVRSKDATNVVSQTALEFDGPKLLADGSIRLKLCGGVGQVCRLESSSDLRNWELVTKLFLPTGELYYSDRQFNVGRYYRLLAD